MANISVTSKTQTSISFRVINIATSTTTKKIVVSLFLNNVQIDTTGTIKLPGSYTSTAEKTFSGLSPGTTYSIKAYLDDSASALCSTTVITVADNYNIGSPYLYNVSRDLNSLTFKIVNITQSNTSFPISVTIYKNNIVINTITLTISQGSTESRSFAITNLIDSTFYKITISISYNNGSENVSYGNIGFDSIPTYFSWRGTVDVTNSSTTYAAPRVVAWNRFTTYLNNMKVAKGMSAGSVTTVTSTTQVKKYIYNEAAAIIYLLTSPSQNLSLSTTQNIPMTMDKWYNLAYYVNTSVSFN